MKAPIINRIYLKIAFVFLLILLLMIPNGWLRSLIWERQSLNEQAVNEISSSWGKDQFFKGLVLSIPYKTSYIDSDGKTQYNTNYFHQLPKTSLVKGDLSTTKKKRGIYEAILYNADLKVSGNFELDNALDIDYKPDEIYWDQAVLSVALNGIEYLDESIKASFNSDNIQFKPGTDFKTIIPFGGANAAVKLDPETRSYEYDIDLAIRGSSSINFIPNADETEIVISADWPSPSFNGSYLPNHEITDAGFTSTWKLSEFNRSIPSSWRDNTYSLNREAGKFGVKLIQTVDHYQKNMRSAKYATLIIGLTFMLYFFFEMLKKIKIHPIQYALVGIALSIFYFLLLSLSEHISFNFAYMISATAVVVLISFYSKFVFRSSKNASALFIILILLYSYIFVLLQLEIYALLAGSVGLFIILALIMYTSRNVDWYNLTKPKEIS